MIEATNYQDTANTACRQRALRLADSTREVNGATVVRIRQRGLGGIEAYPSRITDQDRTPVPRDFADVSVIVRSGIVDRRHIVLSSPEQNTLQQQRREDQTAAQPQQSLTPLKVRGFSPIEPLQL